MALSKLSLTMSNWGNLIIHKFSAKPKKLFLIDGLGALISAIMLGLILVRFENTFGMPFKVLYSLSFMACMFFIYSFLCFLGDIDNWRPYMKLIAFTNLIYCCLTIGLVLLLYQKVTVYGLIYFAAEIIIVLMLASIELITASNSIYRKG